MKGAEILKEWTNQLQSLYDLRESENIAAETLCLLSGFKQRSQFLRAELYNDFSDELKRLLRGEPWQYVCERAYFYEMILKVTPAVLIPRTETEELVHLILQNYSGQNPYKVLDLGTGSGCIPIALSKNRPVWDVYGVDIDENALEIAFCNAQLQNTKVTFFKANILELNALPALKWDIIVSNPPYIPFKENTLMHRNVLDFEPHLALFVPDDNALIFYQSIVKYAEASLNIGGSLYFEINEYLANETKQLLEYSCFDNIQILKDLSGRNRMLSARKI